MSLTELLAAVDDVLDDARVPYMLTGSLASAYYGVPRATQDLDVVIATDADGVERIVQSLLKQGWYADSKAAQEARLARTQFNAIDPATGWKVDFIVRKDRPFSRVEFERRRRVSFLGIEVPLARLEDVLIAKLEWSRLGDSALQRRDVVQLLERTSDELDRAYVETWIGDLGLRDEWQSALEAAERSEAEDPGG